MKTNVSKEGPNERLIEVEISDEELEPHFETAYRKYQKKVRLEGFRKGKVPIALIKKLYGEAIKQDAIEDVVQSVFAEVSQKEQLRPVAPAKLDDVQYEPGSGLKFRARVEVYPEVELKHYKGLSVEREDYVVDEEDVLDALEDVRESMAVMEPVEEPAREGHFVLADFQQVDAAGIPVIGKKYEDRFFQLTTNGGNQELSEQLLGVKPGEKRRVLLTMDKEDPEGKGPVQEYFEVTVKEVKAKRLPDLDDELAKDTGKFGTLEELKNDIRETLVRRTQENSREHFRHHLIDEVLKQNPIDLPESMVQQYLNALVENAKKESNGEVDDETLRERYRPTAVWHLKWELAKDKIAELESLEVTDEDREKYIARLVAERGVDEKSLRKAMKTKKGRQRFEDEILEMKVLDFLEEHAKIKEKKITRKDLEKRRSVAV